MIFRLHLLINTVPGDSRYPYIGIADESNSHIHISREHINLLTENVSDYNENDYFLTSRSVELDLSFIDKLVHDFIQQDDYELVTWLEEKKSMIISYYSWPEGRYTERHIFETHRDEVTGQLIDNLYPMMERLLAETLIID